MSDTEALAALFSRLLTDDGSTQENPGNGYINLMPENWHGPVADGYDPCPARLTLDASWDLTPDELALVKRVGGWGDL